MKKHKALIISLIVGIFAFIFLIILDLVILPIATAPKPHNVIDRETVSVLERHPVIDSLIIDDIFLFRYFLGE